MKKLILLFPALGVLTVIGIQQWQLKQLGAENNLLLAAREEAGQLGMDLARNAELPPRQAMEEEISRLTLENRDLLKLRNEFGVLSEQKPEYEWLRSENQRLLALARTNRPARTELSMSPIYIAKENLMQVGLLTPEAAVQTFYWAQREGDTAAFANCLVPERQESSNTMDAYAHWTFGLRDVLALEIVARRAIGPDKIQLGIRVHTSSSPKSPHNIELTLRLVGTQWKIDIDPRTL